jgi:alpha-mannosidase
METEASFPDSNPERGFEPFDETSIESDSAEHHDETVEEQSPEPEPISFGPGLRPIAFVPNAGQEPALSLTEDDAQAFWVTATALWHPALLAMAETPPRVEDLFGVTATEPREVCVLPEGWLDRLPSGFQAQAADAGVPLVEATKDRRATIVTLLERVGVPPSEYNDDQVALIDDFLALGAAFWWLSDVATGMSHADVIAQDVFTREVLLAARSWSESDTPTAKNRLRAAYEVLTQARERFYPVDAYLVDLTLLDPQSRPEELRDAIESRVPFTLLAPARAIENIANRDPERLAAVRAAVDEGWADLVGGTYSETDDALLPLQSVLWQFRKGSEVYREHMSGRTVETLGRRRFGLYPQLPQIGRRFGFRFALHMGFDAGKFPIRPEMKRLWEGPDNSTLECLNRPPLAADRPSEGVRLPWRLVRSMKDDFTATLPAIHWAGRVSGWYADLRRMHAYSSVLMRQTTVNDFFHMTDRPFDTFANSNDEYVTPYLDQAVRKGDLAPVSSRAEHARLRSRFDAIQALQAMAMGLGQEPETGAPALSEVEQAIELGRRDEATGQLDQAQEAWSSALAKALLSTAIEERSGYLVINPTGVARRVAVTLPDAEADLRPEGPLKAAQFTEEGVSAVVDVAAFGYAWVPKQTSVTAPFAKLEGLGVRDRTMTNESMSVTIDSASGGIRGISGPGEATARLGQQLVIVGLTGNDGKPALSRMKETSFEADYGGPALIQVTTKGSLHHPVTDQKILSYRQRYRLWSGRTTLEIETSVSDIDPTWLTSIEKADPWSNYLAHRWAWPDSESGVRRSMFLHSEATNADRAETGESIDINSRKRRTTMLFGGLAHQKRIRPRMLDTILIAGKEHSQSFQVGVSLDLEHPWHGSLDAIAPAFVVPVENGPPKNGPAGWLISVDNKGVSILTVSYLERSGDGRGWGMAITLVETTGRATRCKVRFFRDPTYARQIDFNDDMIMDLVTDNDGVLIDLTPHEIAKIDVTLG